MYVVSIYQAHPEGIARVREVYPRHRALIDEFAPGGGIVMIGPFGSASEGALAVFRSREVAEAFIARDPFVLEGVAIPQPLREWSPLEFPTDQ